MNAPTTTLCGERIDTLRCDQPAGHPGRHRANVVEVDVIPDPLTDEAARESDRAAWERAVRDEARRLARDRAFCLAVVAWATAALEHARRFASDAATVAILQTFGRSNNGDRVQAWDDAADWLLAIRHDAMREAARLTRARLELHRDGLLWSDDLCDERTPRTLIPNVVRARRIQRKREGARLRALLSIAQDALRWEVAHGFDSCVLSMHQAARRAERAWAAYHDAADAAGVLVDR